jgi:large subunit ribosomal protein L19
MNVIETLEKEEADRLLATRKVPEFQPGDTVRVNVRIKEGERERVQAYEGVCIARGGHGINESFTVRKISFGEGVERLFPVLSPMIESIEVKRRGAAPSSITCAIAAGSRPGSPSARWPARPKPRRTPPKPDRFHEREISAAAAAMRPPFSRRPGEDLRRDQECGLAALDARGVADLHALHVRQDPLRQDMGRPRRR